MSMERLQLEAEVKDNMTPALRKIRQELASIRATPGMQEANGWLGKLSKEAEGFIKSGSSAGSVINAMGIGGLAAGASIGALVTHFRELGERALAMKELGRETGVTVDFVNQFSQAGANFGVTTESMQGALDHFAAQMPEFRRGLGGMFHELSRWPNEVAKLRSMNTQDQLTEIFSFLGQKKFQDEPQLQKQVLESIFGSGDQMEKLFGKGAHGFLDELARKKTSLTPITPEMIAQADEYRKSLNSISTEIDNLSLKVAPPVLGEITRELKNLDAAMGVLNKLGNWLGKAATDPVGAGNDAMGAAKDSLKDLGNAEQRALDDASNFPGEWMKRFRERWSGKKSWIPNLDGTEGPDLPPKNPYGGLELAPKKSSYRGGANGLFHNASFGGPGGGSNAGAYGLEATIASGVKSGTLAAFRELMAIRDLEKVSPGEARAIQASFGGEGHNRLAGGLPRRGRGAGGAGDDDVVPGSPADDPLKKFIAKHESGGYNVVYGHNEGKHNSLSPPKPITQMTIGEILAYQHRAKAIAGSAAFPVGRGQWVERTLRGLTRGMDPNTLFTPELQEKLFDKSIAGRMGQGPSGFRSEWDSLRGVSDSQIRAMLEAHRAWVNNPHTSRSASGLASPSKPGTAAHPEVHIHDHTSAGRVEIKLKGFPKPQLRRWPTMTTASNEA